MMRSLKSAAVILALVGLFGAVGCSPAKTEAPKVVPSAPANSVGTVEDIPQDLRTAATTLAPTILVHRDEQFYPVSVDWYLRFAGLHSGVTGADTSAPTTRETIAQEKTSASTASNLVAPSAATDGWFKKGQSSDAEKGKWPTYIALSKVTVDDQANEYLIANYATLYAFNSYSRYEDANQHYADWEGAAMLFKRPKGTTDAWKFLAVMTHAHDLPIDSTTTPKMLGDRVKVYASKNAHGTFLTEDDSLANFVDLRSDWGTEWNLRTTPNEFVSYTEYTFSSYSAFENGSAVNAAVSAGTATVTQQFSAPWIDFRGKWGQSKQSEPYKIMGVKDDFHWGNSPTTNVGGPGVVYELARLLKAGTN